MLKPWIHVETDNDQSLQIYGLQDLLVIFIPFIFKHQTKDDILLLWTGMVNTIIDSITFRQTQKAILPVKRRGSLW